MEITGAFSLVLHSHLPYVLSHGKWPHGMDWLNEAAAETYIPLLRIFDQLAREGHAPKVTIGISPVLCEQLADPVFKEEFKSYVSMKAEAARIDRKNFEKLDDEAMMRQAANWETFYEEILDDLINEKLKDKIRKIVKEEMKKNK